MASAHGGGFGLPFLSSIEEKLHYFHEEHGIRLPGLGLMLLFVLFVYFFYVYAPLQAARSTDLTLFLSPLWLSLLLSRFAYGRWIQMRRAAYIARYPKILLEIKLPRDTRKSPLAMEAVFSSLHLGPSEGTWYKRQWLGRGRPWWAVEMVSLGGRIYFFIWTWGSVRGAGANAP